MHASNVSKTSMRTSLQAAHARQQNKMKILMASVGKRNVKILALFVSMVLFSTGDLDKRDIHEEKNCVLWGIEFWKLWLCCDSRLIGCLF